jgi:arylsulfatase A-like enzyme
MLRAYAQSTTTIPSHISIMTSKYLKEFGIYTQSENPLPAEYRTLAECLKDAGYATAGFLAAGFMRDAWTGLGQGFDTFVECPVGTLDGEYITNSAIDWLVEHHSERFFMWIHLYDCHVPYDPPDPFRERFLGREAAYEQHLDPSVLPASHDEMTFERLNRDYYSDRYDGAVAYTDDQAGRVVSILKNLGILDKTLIVIAADHGECLGEHSIYFAHVSLYEPNAHVPLIFYWPGHVPAGKRFSELCENVDIYPTILDLLDVEMRGRLSGRSLLPVWRGRARSREGVIAEHSEHAAVSWRTERWTYLYQPIADEAVRAALPRGWLEGPAGQWVLHASREELYNRREDPGESCDKSGSAVEVLEALRGDCAEWVSACDRTWEAQGVQPTSPMVDPHRLQQLRGLGYVR